MGNVMNGEFQVNPNTPSNHTPPVPPPPPEVQDDVIISYGGELTFYMDQNDDAVEQALDSNREERLENIALSLDSIIPKYYLMELNQAS